MEADAMLTGFVRAGVLRVAPETVPFPEKDKLEGFAVGPWT